MFSYEYTILAVVFGLLYFRYGHKNLKFVVLLCETIFEKLKSDRKLTIEEINVNNAHVVKYGDFIVNSIKLHHYYDVKCFEDIPKFNQDKENHNCLIKKENELKSVNLNLEKFKDSILYIPFRPSDRNYKKLYVCIKRISFQEYSIYRYDEKEYIDVKELIDEYEEWLTTPQEPEDLAEAYD